MKVLLNLHHYCSTKCLCWITGRANVATAYELLDVLIFPDIPYRVFTMGIDALLTENLYEGKLKTIKFHLNIDVGTTAKKMDDTNNINFLTTFS